jgi:type IV secretory pathway VirB2 component (pilin)
VSSIQTSSDHRKYAFLSAAAGIIFLAVAIFGGNGDWRGILSFSAGVLWLLVSVQQFRKAKSGGPGSPN